MIFSVRPPNAKPFWRVKRTIRTSTKYILYLTIMKPRKLRLKWSPSDPQRQQLCHQVGSSSHSDQYIFRKLTNVILQLHNLTMYSFIKNSWPTLQLVKLLLLSQPPWLVQLPGKFKFHSTYPLLWRFCNQVICYQLKILVTYIFLKPIINFQFLLLQ